MCLFQVSIPLGKHDDCPISVSFLASHGADKFLLDTVLDVYSSLQEQASIVSHSFPLPDINGDMDTSELLKEKVHCPVIYLFLSRCICVIFRHLVSDYQMQVFIC